MSIVSEDLLKLEDERKVWRITSLRYRDAASGKFISEDEVGDPDLKIGPDPLQDPDSIEKLVLSTLVEVATDPDQAVKSSALVRMLLRRLDKLKMEKAEKLSEGEWFVLGREMAKHVLDLLEAERENLLPGRNDGIDFAT